MKRVLVISALLVACGGDDDDAPAPECEVTAADLRAPTDTNRTCIATLFTTDRPRAAQVLNELDWEQWKKTYELLPPLPVDQRSWYLVALEPHANPRAALSALQAARDKNIEVVFENDIDLAIVRIAIGIKDESTTNTALDRLIPNGPSTLIGAQKLELLDVLAKRSEKKRIDRVCRTADAAIAWRCLELAPGLPETLAAVGRLPVLSYADLDKLSPLRDQLTGLRCVDQGAHGLRWLLANLASAGDATPEEIVIYSRLALDAPDEAKKCFLEEAARRCLSRIRLDKSCPVLDALARYIALGDADDRAKAFTQTFREVVRTKNEMYDRVERSGLDYASTKDARANLFHYHAMLGEILVANPTMFPKPDLPIKTPNYHVIRAYRFWGSVEDKTVTFADTLSPALRKAVCDNKECKDTCQAACAQRPASECQLGTALVEDICGSR